MIREAPRGLSAFYCPVVVELELTRSRDDRRLYELPGVGSLRLEGWLSRAASAEAAGDRWRFRRDGWWQPSVSAGDASGAVVGSFAPRAIRRGGELRWQGAELALRPASTLRERYALISAGRELVLLQGKTWGKRPVRVAITDGTAVEAGLLLFAAFVVRGLAEDAGSTAAAGSVAAVG